MLFSLEKRKRDTLNADKMNDFLIENKKNRK